jgi:hypothetical protein
MAVLGSVANALRMAAGHLQKTVGRAAELKVAGLT